MLNQIHHGDCLDILKTLADNSVDSIVTDPPYGLNFMGKKWDYDVPSEAIWKECLRVLKPGGHLVSFAGSRTYHRMAVRVEDAGFEIRDQLMWVYSQGFPKSLDVIKAIDKAAGAELAWRKEKRQGGGGKSAHIGQKCAESGVKMMADAVTDAAKQWQGWGTALKPSFEPLVIARKPVDNTCIRLQIYVSLHKLKAQLWQLLPANIAELNFPLSPSESAEALNSAQWTAEERCSTQAALSGLTDTLPLESALTLSLNTVLSWLNTFNGLLLQENTSTTGTELSTITDWKILKSCLLKLTPYTIIQAQINQNGLIAPVEPAVRYFSGELLRLSGIQELFAQGSATNSRPIDFQGAAGSTAHEPIVLARKPFPGTVAANVMRHGTGALNIDGCRIGTAERMSHGGKQASSISFGGTNPNGFATEQSPLGRWPANLLHDGSPEVLAGFPNSNGAAAPVKRGYDGASKGIYGDFASKGDDGATFYGDKGSAARFFYCGKASKKDRDEGLEGFEVKQAAAMQGNTVAGQPLSGNGIPIDIPTRANVHPTVKPTAVMQWLCRLITPPGGVILDPFTGSGSTGKAAVLEGFRFIGIEREAEYVDIARARVAAACPPPPVAAPVAPAPAPAPVAPLHVATRHQTKHRVYPQLDLFASPAAIVNHIGY